MKTIRSLAVTTVMIMGLYASPSSASPTVDSQSELPLAAMIFRAVSLFGTGVLLGWGGMTLQKHFSHRKNLVDRQVTAQAKVLALVHDINQVLVQEQALLPPTDQKLKSLQALNSQVMDFYGRVKNEKSTEINTWSRLIVEEITLRSMMNNVMNEANTKTSGVKSTSQTTEFRAENYKPMSKQVVTSSIQK